MLFLPWLVWRLTHASLSADWQTIAFSLFLFQFEYEE